MHLANNQIKIIKHIVLQQNTIYEISHLSYICTFMHIYARVLEQKNLHPDTGYRLLFQ